MNKFENLDKIKEFGKTNKIALLKEVRAITGLELKNAIELVDNILMSNEMPTDPKLVQVINSINTENMQVSLQNTKWSIYDSQELLNELFL